MGKLHSRFVFGGARAERRRAPSSQQTSAAAGGPVRVRAVAARDRDARQHQPGRRLAVVHHGHRVRAGRADSSRPRAAPGHAGRRASQDYGTLSARTIVTKQRWPRHRGLHGAGRRRRRRRRQGRRPCVTIVPRRPAAISPTAQSGDRVDPARSAGVISRRQDTPTARFTFSPPVTLNTPVLFDGSNSCARGLDAAWRLPRAVQLRRDDYQLCVVVRRRHARERARRRRTPSRDRRPFTVTLTVTNDRGRAANSSSQVGATTLADAPTGDFRPRRPAPIVGDTVLFNGDASRPRRSHDRAVQLELRRPGATAANNTASTSRASHVYSAVGSYNVLLSVLDDTGQQRRSRRPWRSRRAAESVVYVREHRRSHSDGGWKRSSAAGTSLIPTYAWTWGDGSSSAGTAAIVSHVYAANGPITGHADRYGHAGQGGHNHPDVTVP